MTFGRVAVLIGIALLVMASNVVISILYMVVYGHLIDPGHEQAYYEDHVKVAAPYCSLVAGIPLMFLAGWWVAGFWDSKFGLQSALIVWVAYATIDLVIILAANGMTTRIGIMFAISFLTKLAAVYSGAIFASRHV